MKQIVASTVRRVGAAATIEEVDISTDAELEARYGEEIPVLLADGKKVAKYRVTEFELRRILSSREHA
jgi:hypothetical protein